MFHIEERIAILLLDFHSQIKIKVYIHEQEIRSIKNNVFLHHNNMYCSSSPVWGFKVFQFFQKFWKNWKWEFKIKIENYVKNFEHELVLNRQLKCVYFRNFLHLVYSRLIELINDFVQIIKNCSWKTIDNWNYYETDDNNIYVNFAISNRNRSLYQKDR